MEHKEILLQTCLVPILTVESMNGAHQALIERLLRNVRLGRVLVGVDKQVSDDLGISLLHHFFHYNLIQREHFWCVRVL